MQVVLRAEGAQERLVAELHLTSQSASPDRKETPLVRAILTRRVGQLFVKSRSWAAKVPTAQPSERLPRLPHERTLHPILREIVPQDKTSSELHSCHSPNPRFSASFPEPVRLNLRGVTGGAPGLGGSEDPRPWIEGSSTEPGSAKKPDMGAAHCRRNWSADRGSRSSCSESYSVDGHAAARRPLVKHRSWPRDRIFG